MKITILSPSLSDNCLGRAYFLAKILQARYELDIVGPVFAAGIWKPVDSDETISYRSVRISGRWKPYWKIRELADEIDGDIIYASKPFPTSFGIGLGEKVFKRKPLVLDIDDWEMGFVKEIFRNLSFSRRLRFLLSSALRFYGLESYWGVLIGEKLSRLADDITVSNSFLQRKFAGRIVWHGRDTEAFNPERFDRELIREKYGVNKNKKVVMFFGSPGPHKGVEDLIEAIGLIRSKDVVLFVVGIEKGGYCEDLANLAGKKLGERFRAFDLQAFEKVPEFLSMADAVVIPQKRNFATIGQVPAKVFDAMAMAKPIIATNVSDLPNILDGCGWIVEAGNSKGLAEKIQYVLDQPMEAKEMGWKARQKCVAEYSWDSVKKVLIQVFKKYE